MLCRPASTSQLPEIFLSFFLLHNRSEAAACYLLPSTATKREARHFKRILCSSAQQWKACFRSVRDVNCIVSGLSNVKPFCLHV
jgi:hypothetical protein